MRFKKIILTTCMLAFAAVAYAGPWPDRPVKLVLGLPPGGGGDTAARILCKELSVRLGQRFFVENRPGADGIIASETVAHSRPDGYTVLMITDFYAISEALNAEKLLQTPLPYHTFTDFASVGRLITMQIMLMANPSLKVETLPELVKLAQASPGKISASHLGIASPHYVALRLLQARSNTKFLEVPYQGSGPATNALLSGDVKIAFTGVGVGEQLAKGNRARAIAVSGPERDPLAPEVPTIAESGYPGYSVLSWMGLLVPANTPKEIIEKLNRTLGEILKDPGVVNQLQAVGLKAAPTSPEAFMDIIKNYSNNVQTVFKDAHIKLNR